MGSYRVTKYNPKFRDVNMHYKREDWTSISDVGESFDGELLTQEIYNRIEFNYIFIATAILLEGNVPFLEVTDLEMRDETNLLGLNQNSIITPDYWGYFFQKVLREDIWCKFSYGNNYVHFGYDYYMFLGVEIEIEASKILANKLNIFIEDFPSPHMTNDN